MDYFEDDMFDVVIKIVLVNALVPMDAMVSADTVMPKSGLAYVKDRHTSYLDLMWIFVGNTALYNRRVGHKRTTRRGRFMGPISQI